MISAAVVSIALLLQSATSDKLPLCGSLDRDIGRGFALTQHMFDGVSQFTLTYRPQAKQVGTHGVMNTAPFHFIFSQMAFEPQAAARTGFAGPQVGYGQYRFVKPSGARLATGIPSLACGGGVVLTNDFSKSGPSPYDVPSTFLGPFFGQDQKACIAQLSRDGRYRFTVRERAEADPAVVIEGRMDLKWALAEVERLWRVALERGRSGACRIGPPPPPPF